MLDRRSENEVVVVAKYSFYSMDIENALINLGYRIIKISNLEELYAIRESINPKVPIFFPHFSNLLPDTLLSRFLCIGFHTGDLPRDRGGSPIQNKIIRGEYKTKVSALRLVPEMDAGPVFTYRQVDLSFGNIDDMLRRISLLIADMVKEILIESPEAKEQGSEFSTFKRLSKSENKLDFELEDLQTLYDKIRMVDGLDYERAYFQIGEKKFSASNAVLNESGLSFTSTIQIRKKRP
jgi:methionyl-tRNA formyltransferase